MKDIKWTNLTAVLERFAEAFIKNAQQNLEKKDANASGALQRSMELDKIVIDDKEMRVTISLEDYWYYLEHGRKAGKMPPIQPIIEWIENKPVPPKVQGLTVKQQAFAIARGIGKNGTKPKPFFNSAKQMTWKMFKDEIAEAVDMDIMAYIENQVLPEMERLVGAK